ncbi:MAG: glutamine synthetase, partial [Dehalococcoidia bacterium]
MSRSAVMRGPSAPNATGMRVENRTPGADVCAYLGFAACIAGGLSGIERNLAPPPPMQSDVYKSEGLTPLPATLGEAIALFEASSLARDCFGDAFVDHYVAMRRWEVDKGSRAVTEWERRRYFEQV